MTFFLRLMKISFSYFSTWDKIDISEGIDAAKSNDNKEYMICN